MLWGVVGRCGAVTAGHVAEALLRPLRGPLRSAPPVPDPLTVRQFLQFYVPLALTSLIHLLILPINSLALSRMPQALSSLAVWPVIGGLAFVMRGLGIAYNAGRSLARSAGTTLGRTRLKNILYILGVTEDDMRASS